MKVVVGDRTSFSKTVGESDVYLFAGISGDFYEAHVNEQAMASTAFGRRIAHGALLVGYMSAAGTAMIRRVRERDVESVPVSLGYDRLRFTAPVFIGDTITVDYTVTAVETARARSVAEVKVTNQGGGVVAFAEHIMKWLAPEASVASHPDANRASKVGGCSG